MPSLLATVLGNLYLFFGSLVVSTIALLFGWLPPRGRWVFACARAWSHGLLAVTGVRVQASFLAPLAGSSSVFMVNHQSLFDIPILLATLPTPAVFMVKEELMRLPFFGWALRLGGFIPVARGDRARARQSFAAAVDRVRQGASVLIFPEETRSPDGTLLPFKRGGFLLAQKSGRPIVPVGIRGTLAVHRKGRLRIEPGQVTVAYGAPIDGAAFGPRGGAELAAAVREQIAALAATGDHQAATMPDADAKVEPAGKG